MSLVEPHPTDEGKFQSTVDDYGHGPGNGKSRSAVYKHAKKVQSAPRSHSAVDESTPSEEHDSDENQVPGVAGQPIEITEEEEESRYSSISWADDETDEIHPNTIPTPIRRLNSTKSNTMDMESTGRMARYGYVVLDRMLTHWGRAVMNQPDYEIKRTDQDLDVLESSTVALLDHYGVSIPMSPVLVFSATVGAAYIPPVSHIVRNADPNARGGLRAIIGRLNPLRVLRRFRGRRNARQSVPAAGRAGGYAGVRAGRYDPL